MIGMSMRDQDVLDFFYLADVFAAICEDLIGRQAHAGIDERRLVSTIHQVDMAVPRAGHVESGRTAAHQIHVFTKSHGTVESLSR